MKIDREVLKQIANTIISQLGGARFKVMVGASNFMFGATEENLPYLKFNLPARFAKDNITIVRIVLNDMDTYDVEYMKLGRVKNKFGGFSSVAVTVAKSEGLYDENLQSDFTEKTGLDTHM